LAHITIAYLVKQVSEMVQGHILHTRNCKLCMVCVYRGDEKKMRGKEGREEAGRRKRRKGRAKEREKVEGEREGEARG
jgi:hypothetical protein